ncbi:uncharacterized protein Z520_12124 [Fonsecaea multimorphosa CBS 102226]|uniref:Protein ZIP4 homolog n=1 Tax=Fonsecaea multimorphosa CBS 102226 TaxID=1442371 RepID=A0A0D2I4A3_9EURO|nr:uncharacterized protein Z520_12124 [Fonsecaea multimorphosa CBS 102226]KIX92131.1 hypothetical protein Z520_12124 [Fonsecaea multimorphosa CBS 102226]
MALCSSTESLPLLLAFSQISQMSPKDQASAAGSILGMLATVSAANSTNHKLDFTSHLESALSNEVNVSAEGFPDLSVYLDALPLPRKALAPGQRLEFDRKGVVLWNTCCKLSRSEGSSQLRVNLAKDAGLVDIASKVIEQLASKLEAPLKRADHEEFDSGRITESLNAQFLLMRIILAWKQGRLDLAEHFYSQLEAFKPQLCSVRIGELLDLCYEIGNDQLNQKNHNLAVKWLKRGFQLTTECGTQIEDVDILDLRLALIHTCAVRALLAINEPQAGQEAFQILQGLREEFGHKLPVILLQLELSAKDPSANPDAFSAGKANLALCASSQNSEVRLASNAGVKLTEISTSHAIRVLESYIVLRLAPSDEYTWTENAIVTLIWLMTVESSDHDNIDPLSLEEAFDKIQQAWNRALSAEATHGALILLWKQIEHTFDKGLKDNTTKWCQVALHQLLAKAGDNNVGKIERKIVKCQIDLCNLEAAYATLEKMPPARRQHPLSRYLRYCLALRREDEADARSTLASLATVHDDRNKLLFAAVSEATRYGSKFQGAQLLQRILDKYKDNLPAEIDASALLRRCTARLLLLAVSEADDVDEELLSRLCGIFKSAALFTQKQRSERATLESQLPESRWFEKTSYNTAVQYLQSWPAKYVIDLLYYSCQIHLPTHAPVQVRCEKLIHEVDAKYIQAILYTVEARAAAASDTTEAIPKTAYAGKAPPSSPTEIKSTLYRNVIANYFEIQSHRNALGESHCTGLIKQEVLEAIAQKLIALAPLAFEAVLFLGCTSTADVPSGEAQFHDELSLARLVDQMVQLNPPQKTYSVFADMILSAFMDSNNNPFGQEGPTRSVLPISTTTNLIAKLISGLRNHPGYDTSQAARWVRCVVQVVLDGREYSHQAHHESKNAGGTREAKAKGLRTVAKITEHALNLGRRSAPPDQDQGYPPEELEWLAATLFNLSIDLYASASASTSESPAADVCVGQDQGDKHQEGGQAITRPQFWAKRAVEIADVLAMMDTARGGGADAGMLAQVLRERCRKLHWDV